MPYPGWSKPWEQQLVEEVEQFMKDYNACRARHPSNFQPEQEEQPHGEYPPLPGV